jgi:phosphate transport system protein
VTDDVRRAFHADLDQVTSEVVRLSGLVTDTIPRATEIFLTGDLDNADALIRGDDALDRLTHDLEERIYQILALQQPILSADLRVLITALRLSSELERSGDLMVNVAKAARRIYQVEVPPKVRGLIQVMSEQAATLMQRATDAYVSKDLALAGALDDMDDQLDEAHRDFLAAIFEQLPNDRAELQALVQLALIGRFYERVGDHAVNIGEWTTYLVTGLVRGDSHG